MKPAIERIADALEVLAGMDGPKQGKWIRKQDKCCYWYACSECGEKTPLSQYRNEWFSAYCPNCGAEMEVEHEKV